jgi:hypothetical protein
MVFSADLSLTESIPEPTGYLLLTTTITGHCLLLPLYTDRMQAPDSIYDMVASPMGIAVNQQQHVTAGSGAT